ncbi:hypothetical protein RRG08_036513 [Elysia crispata]|uniref:Uncharacterized protein n=1 Tax=Elysia crispata TaxID=231223 RepID=A0AAE0ZK42_9GAST|nr:hypothetical protein RRG08_036513 [Elysia crispata]
MILSRTLSWDGRVLVYFEEWPPNLYHEILEMTQRKVHSSDVTINVLQMGKRQAQGWLVRFNFKWFFEFKS